MSPHRPPRRRRHQVGSPGFPDLAADADGHPLMNNALFQVLIQAARDLSEGKSVLLTSGDDFTTPRAAGEVFGIGHEHLRAMIDRGELTSKPAGLLRLVSLKDVHEHYLRQGEQRHRLLESLRDALQEAKF